MPGGTTEKIAPVEQLKAELALIEEKVITGYTFADAIREGASVTDQLQYGYVHGARACGNGAAWIAAAARGYIPEA